MKRTFRARIKKLNPAERSFSGKNYAVTHNGAAVYLASTKTQARNFIERVKRGY